MDEGTKLALRAVLRGLRKSGHIGGHSLAVIVDELRYAAREARDQLYDQDAVQIEDLARELGPPPCDGVVQQTIRPHRRMSPTR